MKNTKFAPAALCLGALLLAAPVASADSHGDRKEAAPAASAPAADPANDAMMAEMMKSAQPGPEHKMLESMVGTWKATISMWSGPGDPQKSEGSMVNTMQLGGRALEARFKGSFMGMPMEGVGFTGFDNMKKEWWSIWMDVMSTGAMFQTGAPSADGKSNVVRGMSVGMDGKPAEFVSTTKLVDADSHVYTMATKMGDQVVPMMEITYTRAK